MVCVFCNTLGLTQQVVVRVAAEALAVVWPGALVAVFVTQVAGAVTVAVVV